MSEAAPARRSPLKVVADSFGGLVPRGPAPVRDIPLRAAYRRPGRGGWLKIALYVLLAAALFGYGYGFAATAPFLMTQMLVPQAILAALIIWCLPPGDYAPVKTLEPLVLLFFAALVLWPNYLAIALPGLPWLTLTRIFGTPLTLALMICLSVSKNFRKTLMDCLNTDPWVWKAFVALVFFQTFSLLISDSLATSVSRYVLAQTNWTAIFVVSCYIFLKPGAVDRFAKLYFFTALIVAFIGVWEFRLGAVPWAGHIPSFLKIEDEAVLRALAGARRAATGIYRVQSTATGPLGLAELLGLAAPFALHFAIGRYPIWLRVTALASLPLFVFIILLTDSRLGVVCCLVGLMAYLLFWALLRWRKVKDSIFAPAMVFAYPGFFAMMVAATFVVGKLRNKVWGGGAQAASTASREIQWEMAIPKILSHPFGYGVARSGHALGFAGPNGVTTIDSYYLSIFLDIGIPGFIVFYFIFLRAAWTGAKNLIMEPDDDAETMLLIPLCVCLVSFVIIKSVFSQDGNHPLVFMILGAVLALVYRAQKRHGTAKLARPAPEGEAKRR